jgi:hypothetical protein
MTIGMSHDHIVECLRRAAEIRNHQKLDARALLQRLTRQMRQRAASGRGIGDLARPFFRKRDELWQRRHVEGRRDGYEKWLLADEADRNEIARHLKRQVGLQAPQGHECRGGGHVQSVTIGSGSSGGARRHRSAGARMIKREDLTSPHLRQAVGDDPQQGIGGAARRRMRDDPNRPGGKVLRLRARVP